jgi:hypothetical protein
MAVPGGQSSAARYEFKPCILANPAAKYKRDLGQSAI